MRRTRQEVRLRGWLEVLPDEVVRVRPVLSAYFAGVLLMSGELEGVEGRLRDAERWLEPATGEREEPHVPRAEMIVADEEEYRRLPAVIETYRAGQALARGDASGTVRHAERAIELVVEDDHLCRASAALLGLVYWGSGDLEAGHRGYSACVEGLRRAGFIADILGCSIALADIRSTQGRLGEALRTLEQALQLVELCDGQGRVLASGVGSDLVDSLLGIIGYMLPAGHPDRPDDEPTLDDQP
jgi:LuxR family transcriptional regulator, maltose regulon positive regulatory protein